MFNVKSNIALLILTTVFVKAPLNAQNVVKFGKYDPTNIGDLHRVGRGFGKPNPPTPEGSVISKTEYFVIIDDQGDPSHFRCDDYAISFSSSNHGEIGDWFSGDIIYDRLGGATDGGFDDDAQDDSDIFLFRRESHFFDGETPNQQWYVQVRDTQAGNVCTLVQSELYIYYTFHDLMSEPSSSVSPDHVYPGEELSVSWDIVDPANVRSDQFTIQFYASTDTDITQDDFLLDTSIINNIKGFLPLKTSITIPDMPSGQYYIGCILDTNNSIEESDETNNISYVGPIQIGAETLHVDDNGANDPGPNDVDVSDPNEDGSPAHPYDSIQEAIDAASDGSVITVLPGYYPENINFAGKSLKVQGLTDANDPTCFTAISDTIIDGNQLGPVVTMNSGEDANTMLMGLTLTGGYATMGGGVYCDGSSPFIGHCLIIGNRAYNSPGGGIYCRDSHAVFMHCTISGNYASEPGGGIHVDGLDGGSNVHFFNCILWDNIPDQISLVSADSITVTYSDIQNRWIGTGNIAIDPEFANQGMWIDPLDSLTAVTPDFAEAQWTLSESDYHLLSTQGRYDPTTETWITDPTTSVCIDAGDPSTDWQCEPAPNHGSRSNMGVFGNTPHASQTPVITEVIYQADLDSDPGWQTQGEWMYGVPQGLGNTNGQGHIDPTSGATGQNVYGVNLSGDYSIMTGGPYCLTMGPIDCSNYHEISLGFSRWLNSDISLFVNNAIEVSNDGTNWEEVWSPGPGELLNDDSWQTVTYLLGSVADGQSTVFVRWCYEILSDQAFAYTGWNIDDVTLAGVKQ